MKTVKYIRVVLSVAVLALLATVIALGGGDEAAHYLLTVDVAMFSLGACIAWLIITLLLGRVYCSTACPMGVLQDIAAWLAKRLCHRGKGFYRFQPGDWRLRGIIALLVIISATGDSRTRDVALYSDPYSLVVMSSGWYVGLLGMLAALMITVAIMVIAWRTGRTFCNTICPVGTALGAVSQFSLMQLDINPDLCVGCGACEQECKSSCVNAMQHTIDHSRCVMCMNCAAVCPNDAIKYRVGKHRLTTPLLRRATTATGMAKQEP